MVKVTVMVMAMTLLSIPPVVAFAQINQSNTTDTNSQTTPILQDDSFLTYQNATLGISIQYPSGWIKEEQEDGAAFISPPSENNSEASSVIVDVQIANLSLFSLSPSAITLQNYTNSTIEELTDANYTIIDLSSATVGIGGDDIPVHRLVSSKQDDDFIMQQMQIYTIMGNTLYSITYIAEDNNNLVFLPTVEKMIDSFTITNGQEREGMLLGG